jgi:hypothetical protein
MKTPGSSTRYVCLAAGLMAATGCSNNGTQSTADMSTASPVQFTFAINDLVTHLPVPNV